MSRLEEWAEQRLTIVGRSGNEIIAECPWCGKPRLYLNVEKRKFICYRGCASGDAINLVAEVDKLTKRQAKERVYDAATEADLFDELAELNRGGSPAEEPPVRVELPDAFIPCFDGKLWRVPVYASSEPPAGRGLDDDDLVRHGIGYVRGSHDRWQNRLVVPVSFRGARTFVARLMGPPSKYAWENAEGETVFPERYLYPKGSDVSRLLYWGDNIRPGAELIVVEGVFDCIRLVGLGYDCVATFGKRLSPTQAKLISELRPESVTVMYDQDARAESARAASDLSHRTIAYFATTDSDPDEAGFWGGVDAIDAALDGRQLPIGELDALEIELMNLRD